jgi:inhibitor of KinA sporulation pathway (predicted exonuclease)
MNTIYTLKHCKLAAEQRGRKRLSEHHLGDLYEVREFYANVVQDITYKEIHKILDTLGLGLQVKHPRVTSRAAVHVLR